jgi:hypothetical protein
MIKIATVHPDVIGAERLKVGAPRLNAEWLELFNAASRAVNVFNYFVLNDRGDGFTLTLARSKRLVVGAYESLLIFSGAPDNPRDPAPCFLSNAAHRLFLGRQGYFWNAEEDLAYLYHSRDAYLETPGAYVDLYHYRRHSALIIVGK